MSLHTVRPCNCGSEKPSMWQVDAKGIPLTRTCEDCHEQRMSKYRPEVLVDAGYEFGESDSPYDYEY